jgi:type I restriction enzyme, S subunit
MSRIDELMKEFCPNGVEYFVLGDISTQYAGFTAAKNKWAVRGNCEFIDYMNAYKNITIDVTNLKYATIENFNKTTAMIGDVLFTGASETPDECAISSVIEDEIKSGVYIDDHLFAIRFNDDFRKLILPGYAKYVFRSSYFREEVRKTVRGVTRFYISKRDFMKLSIPVPPLVIQDEIIKTLDKFGEYVTSISQGLSAEIAARRKQYEYYRNKLLTF